jgi:hypothetical protein
MDYASTVYVVINCTVAQARLSCSDATAPRSLWHDIPWQSGGVYSFVCEIARSRRDYACRIVIIEARLAHINRD